MKKISVKKAVLMAYDSLPAIFGINELYVKVVELTDRFYLTDGCVMRRLRELRYDDGLINYKYDYKIHKYRKEKRK